MTRGLTAEEFQERAGAAEWRVGDSGATATFATGSFARGVEFVNEIGRLADAAKHHPDVELT
jgi:4a-hydroxytetrahydrobiopterin dehydratase